MGRSENGKHNYFTHGRDGKKILWVDMLTPESVKDYTKAFSAFDKNDDGTISTKELGIVMRSLGKNPTEVELADIMNEADLDGSGAIDYPEFLTMMAKKEREAEDDVLIAFDAFDRTGSGIVSAKEIHSMMCALNIHGGDMKTNLTNEIIEEIMQEISPDGRDKINYKELIKETVEQNQNHE